MGVAERACYLLRLLKLVLNSSSFWVSETSSSLSLKQQRGDTVEWGDEDDVTADKVFFSPHLQVEAGTCHVSKLSKHKERIDRKPFKLMFCSVNEHSDSQDEGFVPKRVERLFLYVCLVYFVI